MNPVAAIDLSPLLGIAALGVALAGIPLVWFWRRQRGAVPADRLRALALLALFLSFDLVLLGAFTRLSDSGLGCPDWPGCYGQATPLGARSQIGAAEAALPSGPVTHGKAWIEMTHRYAAVAIGVLVLALAVLAWLEARRRRIAATPAWAIATLLWICVQGGFGALTVTMKLYPSIVVLHLLGGMALLALLTVQAEAYRPRRLALAPPLRAALVGVAVLAAVQVALGGWVSANYAVLACRDFPTCQGSVWPPMQWHDAFSPLRPLGGTGDGGILPFPALTAIHMAHRLGAALLLPALVALAWRLFAGGGREARPWAWALLAIAAWQTASGLATVLLGWPLVSAVGHSAGAAALVVVLSLLLARSWTAAPALPGPGWNAVARRPAS